MNKVFKVIWSEARNAYVVVSEIAKNHGSKSCSTKKLLTMLIATGVMTCASMAPAMAATNVDSNANVTVKKGATVTVAENATVTVGDNAIALGKGAYAVKNSIAIGNGAYTQDGSLTKGQSVALGNGAVTADSTDAVNGSQLHAVATEAGKHSKVVNGSNINVEEFDNDGQKIYKVNLNKDIMLGDLTGKYVNISGTNGTIEPTGYIATQDRVYADKGAKLADIDVTGNKISNGASSIVMDGSNVKVNDKVTID